MSELRIRNAEWVVVCDGAKALLLENAGDEKFPNLKTVDVFEHDDPRTRELGTEKPGRAHSSFGQGRSSYEQTDWHDRTEEAFLAELVQRLDAALASGKVRSMVVVAPPRALGMLRTAYTPALRQAVQAELDKDFVKLPVHEIERHLTAA